MFNRILKRTTDEPPQKPAPFVVPPGKRAFNDRTAQAEARSHNAMRLAYGSLAVAFIAIVFGIRATFDPRPEPHVILVGNDGRAASVKLIRDDPVLRDKVVEEELTNFVHALFTRTGSFAGDQFSLARDVQPFIVPGDPAYTTINGYLANPSNNLKTATTLSSVEVDVPQKRAADSWYVKWQVTQLKSTGEKVGVANLDVTVLVKFRDLATAPEQDANPTGLQIVTFPYQTFGLPVPVQ